MEAGDSAPAQPRPRAPLPAPRQAPAAASQAPLTPRQAEGTPAAEKKPRPRKPPQKEKAASEAAAAEQQPGKPEAAASAAKKPAKSPPAACKPAEKGRGGWWTRLPVEEACPITLEPLCELACPPFELRTEADGGRSSLFDAASLHAYFTAARAFANPLTRQPVTREECLRLEEHCRKHRLLPKPPGPSLGLLWDEAAAAAAAAASAGARAAEALAAERLATAEHLLRSFYGGGRRAAAREAAPFARAPPAAPAPAADGPGLWLVDDDAEMARGLSRSAAEARAAAAPRPAERQDPFPALPPAAPPPPPRAPPAAPARPPSWWRLAAPPPPPPPAPPRRAPLASAAMPVFGPGAAAAAAAAPRAAAPAERDGAAAAARRAQLAAAFGVADPERHASCFAASAAEAFSEESLALARAEPGFAAELERRFDAALAGGARRVSLPPMPRGRRRLAHELGALYRIVTSSYGEGAARHIDLFLVPQQSGPPSIRLTDAILAAPKAAAPPPPQPAAIFFHEVSPTVDMAALLAPWEGQFELSSAGEGSLMALFSSARAAAEARDRLGGGVRGKFTVSAPPPPPPERRAESRPAKDAWEDEEEAPQRGKTRAAPPAAKAADKPRAANIWAALGEEGMAEEEEEEEGEGDGEWS